MLQVYIAPPVTQGKEIKTIIYTGSLGVKLTTASLLIH